MPPQFRRPPFPCTQTALLIALAACPVTVQAVEPVLLKDINPSATASSLPAELTSLGARVVFTADDGVRGRELWVTDGTATGTVLLKELIPGTEGLPWQTKLVAHDGSVYFTDLLGKSQSPQGGRASLWASDGTVGNTRFLTLLSTADNLWEVNGTPERLHLVTTATTGGGPASSRTTGTLWRWQPSTGATELFSDFFSIGHGHALPSDLTRLGNRLLFASHLALNTIEDGTPGFALLRDLSADFQYGPRLVAAGNLGFFTDFYAPDKPNGRRLWVTDGTPAGTALLTSSPAKITDMKALADTLLFLGEPDPALGTQAALWRSDGTNPGTREVTKLFPEGAINPDVSLMGDDPTLHYLSLNQQRADGGQWTHELWKTDGRAEGTQRLAALPERARAVAYHQGRQFFTVGAEIWRSRGTPESTRKVATLKQPEAGQSLDRFAVAGSHLVFRDTTTAGDQELFALRIAPGVSTIPQQVLTANTQGPAIAFTVEAAEGEASQVQMVAESSNPALLPVGNIQFGGSGMQRTVQLKPAPNATGAATVTLIANEDGLESRSQFSVTVRSAPRKGGGGGAVGWFACWLMLLSLGRGMFKRKGMPF